MFLINKDNVKAYLVMGFLLIIFLISASVVFSHGGKHAQGKITHLQALKNATELYDRLIGNGKLDQSWENKLAFVKVSNRQNGPKDEIMVSFHRSEGDPKAVYIFFNNQGKYSGSNFTGD